MRLALFGGTFDPIHNAHLAIAEEAARRFALDRVWFVPAARPPHKGAPQADYEDRYRMIELALRGRPRFEPSRLEEGTAHSYSIDTIAKARQMLAPGDRLFFLMGADAFAEIETWHRWREVAAAVEFIVVSRPGHDFAVAAGVRAHRLEALWLDVSSSGVRRKLARGEDPPEVPLPVLAYIREHGLYRADSSQKSEGKSQQSKVEE